MIPRQPEGRLHDVRAARGAGVRSEISNSVGRASERKAPAREAGGTEREGAELRKRKRASVVGGRARDGEESRKVPQGNGYQNCACHYNFKAGFPRSFSLAPPPVLPRPAHIRRVETGAAGARQRGKGRKRARRASERGREREEERLGGRGNAGNPREGGSFISPLRPSERGSERARARGIIYREDSRESTQRASERGRGRGTG